MELPSIPNWRNLIALTSRCEQKFIRFLVCPCTSGDSQRIWYRKPSEPGANALCATVSSSRSHWVLGPMALLPAAVPCAYFSRYLCPSACDCLGSRDNVWFILLIPSIQYNIWYTADANSYVAVKNSQLTERTSTEQKANTKMICFNYLNSCNSV